MSDNAPDSTPTPDPTPEESQTETAASTPSADERVAVLESKLLDIEVAMLFAAKMRKFMLLSIVILLVVIGGLFGQLVSRIQSPDYLDEIQQHATAHLEKNSAIYLDEARRLVADVQPKLTSAFMSQAKKDTPEYTKAIDRQRDLLAKNLESRFTQLLNDRYEESLKKSEDILVAEFPLAKDEEIRRQLMANMNRATQKVAQQFQVEFFKEELNNLYEVWDTFPRADIPEEGEQPLQDQLVYQLLDWFKLRLSGQGTALVEVTPDTVE